MRAGLYRRWRIGRWTVRGSRLAVAASLLSVAGLPAAWNARAMVLPSGIEIPNPQDPQSPAPPQAQPEALALPETLPDALPEAGPQLRPSIPAPAPVDVPRGDGTGFVQAVRVTGNRRIEAATVKSYLLLKEGDPFDSERMDRSLKELFATGLFSDVGVRREGATLVIEVSENPIINRLAYEGNRKIEKKTLESEVPLKPRQVYTRTKVQNAVKRILELYRRGGRFAATVEPKIVRLPQNRVDLIFEVHEGDVTGIKSIRFIGNRVFGDSRLRGVIATKETVWWRILGTSDTYDPDRIAFDRDVLRRFYLTSGYADFRVVSAVAEMAPDRSGFYVTFTVDEGEPYKYGAIEVKSDIKSFKSEELRDILTLEPGGQYNGEEIEKNVDILTDEVGKRGYAFVDIRPRVLRDRDKRIVNVTYHVAEAPRVFVERIDIVGNTQTLDRVVRREFRLVEGDAFNTAKMQRSETRIKNLGFFEKVQVTNQPGSRPDRTVVKVDLHEQATGELSIGAGVSSSQGALGSFGVREHNLLGRGQDLRLNFTVSQRTQELDMGFTEPYFLNRDVSAGVDLFRIKEDFLNTSAFEQKSLGGSLRAGYSITEHLRHTVSYNVRSDKIAGVSFFASRFIRDQEGTHSSSGIGHALVYDTRDDRFNPTLGYYVSAGNSVTGLGGGAHYLRSELKGGYWYSLDKDWVASVQGTLGNTFDYSGRRVRISDRFFVGSDSFRGFAVAGIGPRDIVARDALGGNREYLGTFELRLPLGLPDELGITGALFSDFGTLTGLDEKGPEIRDSRNLRASAGFGLAWKSPFGPVRVDLAKAIRKDRFDETQVIHFNFGTRFQ